MIKKSCPNCQESISLAWFIGASSGDQYRCLSCSEIIGFGKAVTAVSLIITGFQVIATLFIWHLYDHSYPVLLEHQMSGFQINLLFVFSLAGLFISARLLRLLFVSLESK